MANTNLSRQKQETFGISTKNSYFCKQKRQLAYGCEEGQEMSCKVHNGVKENK